MIIMEKNLKSKKSLIRVTKTLMAVSLFLWIGISPTKAKIPTNAITVTQQKMVIKGLVVDENGETFPGVNVVVKGTTNGTLSDIKGNFSLSVPNKNSVLVFSFIGYKNKEVTLNSQTFLKIQMISDVKELNEIVVTALGIKREKKALGYAMQEVKTEDLSDNKSVSVANLLQGKIAGVQISQSGTGMGGSTRIVLRGLNSLSGNNQPLWVVDGFPINDDVTETADQWGGTDRSGAASQINPENIKSISVLKGANAAALYGSRAQNGAIIITTKSGRENQPLQLEYNGSVTFTDAFNSYDYQNVYGQGSNGTFSTSAMGSWGPKMQGQTVTNWRNSTYGDTSYEDYAMLPQKDYISDFYRQGTNYNNSLTLSGGGKNITGRFSFTDSRNEGITPNHSLNKQYFDMNTEFKNDRFTVGVKGSYMRQNSKNVPGQGEYGLMVNFVKMPRSIHLQDLKNPVGTDGNLVNWCGPLEAYSNPYGSVMSENGNSSYRNRIIGQINTGVKITDYLRINGRIGIDWYNDDTRNYNEVIDPTSNASQYSRSTLTNEDLNADVMLNFNKKFNDFSVTGNLGSSLERQKYTSMSGATGKFTVADLVTLSNGQNITVSEGYSKREIHSVFANATLGYKSMAYIDVTGRNDWSSTLPANNRSYFYPSVSLSGIVSEIFKLPRQISYLKIRASWAQVGNDTDPYNLSNVYSIYNNDVNSDIVKVKLSDTYPLYNLKPEKTNSYEIGTNIRMFGDRLGADLTYYNSNTVNQILSIGMPESSGYTAKRINAGKIQSYGWEFMINGTPIKNKDWKWDVTLNWGMNRTKCIKLNDEIKRYTLGEVRIGKVVVDEGGQMGDIVSKAYKRDDNGKIIVDDNGLPESESSQVIGNMMPKWTGSFSTGLQYKNLSFNALIDVRYGGDFVSMTDDYACEFGNSAKTLSGRDGMVVDGVTESGATNTKQITAETYYSNIAGPYGVGEQFMYKGTYVKMRELSLGYSFPEQWLSRFFIKSAKFSIVGRDLFYFYKDAPVNPEGAFSREDYAQAFELASMPPTRSWGFSLNVKF